MWICAGEEGFQSGQEGAEAAFVVSSSKISFLIDIYFLGYKVLMM